MEGCVPTRIRLILVYAQTRGHWSMLLEVSTPVQVLMLVHVLMPRPQARDAGVYPGIVAGSRPTRARARVSW